MSTPRGNGPREVIDLFLDCASRLPGHPAIVSGADVMDYAGLEQRAREFGGIFAARPGSRIVIALPQTADVYAAMLGAGLAGGYYVPLNLAAPVAKLQRIVQLAEPDFIVASGEMAALLHQSHPDAGLVDPVFSSDVARLSGPGTRHHLAYIIFTSGSTGDPKGVMVPRTGLNHYTQWMGRAFAITPDDRWSQHPNLAFDLSVVDVYGALCHGATLYPLVSESDRLMPARMIARHKLTIWNSVPSVLNLMMQAGQLTAANLASLRLMTFCGEPLLPEHVRAIFAARPDVLVQNTYGPTEATVSMTELPLRVGACEAAMGDSVAIGEAIAGMGMNLVGGPDADEGEIVITGPQLADGYWRDPGKTAAAFRDVTVDGQVQRGYHTGDWAVRRNGHVFFRERIDFQVKVMGFRVELDEVASAIRDCGWPVACVFKRGDGLAAVVEACAGQAFDEQALRAQLSAKIERHAVPQMIKLVDRMPRNDNDKLDRKAAAAWFESQESPP